MPPVGHTAEHWPQLMQVGSAKNSEVDRGFSSFSVNLDSTMPRGLRCSARTCSRAAMRFAVSRAASSAPASRRLRFSPWAGAYRYVQLPTDFTLNEASRLMPCASNRRLPKTRAVLPTNAPQLITAKQ